MAIKLLELQYDLYKFFIGNYISDSMNSNVLQIKHIY